MRQDKVNWFINQIDTFFNKKPTGVISRKKLVAKYALANNSTERTGKEILDTLANSGYIKLNKDDITK